MRPTVTKHLVFVAALWLAFLATSRDVESHRAAAAIRGVVVTADEVPSPVARAMVTLSPAKTQGARSTLTDQGGAFSFGDVAAGQYTLSATKAGYLKGDYGAIRPGGAGIPLVVNQTGDLTGLALTLVRGASISGFIHDQRGDPMAGALVTALRWVFGSTPFDRGVRALRAMPGVRQAVSDARGAYRIFDLPPG